MTIWVILFAAALAPALVVGAVLFWAATNAILQKRGITGEAAILIESLSRAFRSIYGDTVRQPLPEDLLGPLCKLTQDSPKTD
jgi:hypothetical protein